MSARATLAAALLAALMLAGCGATRHADLTRLPAPATLASAPLRPPLATDSAYRKTTEARIAQRLHTPVRDLVSQLRSTPGSTLMNLAKPLGLSQDQLGAIVLASINNAADAAVRSGRWTSTAARKEKRYWTVQPAPSLIAEVTRWLLAG